MASKSQTSDNVYRRYDEEIAGKGLIDGGTVPELAAANYRRLMYENYINGKTPCMSKEDARKFEQEQNSLRYQMEAGRYPDCGD